MYIIISMYIHCLRKTKVSASWGLAKAGADRIRKADFTTSIASILAVCMLLIAILCVYIQYILCKYVYICMFNGYTVYITCFMYLL